MVIRQGDIYWVELKAPRGSEPALRHPMLVVQNDRFNRSSISTSVVVSLTSNMIRAASPGNVVLRKGEANLPRRSVVNVTQIETVNKYELVDLIGRLSHQRIREVLVAHRFVAR